MVNNLFESVVENEYIQTNISHLECLKQEKQCECVHLPIFLGESSTTFLVKDGIEYPKPYKRCLLCGADVSFKEFLFEFDARNYLKKDNETFEDWNIKYLEALKLFKELCHYCKTKEEVYQYFSKKLNDEYYQKNLKKPISNKK